jgi:hypothetical protein
MANMITLRNIFVQNNMLTGSLDGVFNHSVQLSLSTIDASNNRFGGSVPDEIFLLPELRVLSLSGTNKYIYRCVVD